MMSITVLYILHSSTKYTGSNISLVCMLEGLLKLGVKPIVIMPKRKDMSLRRELKKMDVIFYEFNYSMPVYPGHITLRNKISFLPKMLLIYTFNYLAIRQIKKVVKRHNPKIIHTNVGPLLLGDTVAKGLKIPHVWHLREFQNVGFKINTFYTHEQFKVKIARRNNYIIANSRAVSNHFNLGLNSTVIYNGIMKASLAQFTNLKEKYFLFVGYLREEKGIEELLIAFGKLAKCDTEYSLLVVGHTTDTSYFEKLQNIVIREDIDTRVSFLGHRDDVFSLMSRATALIVPSINEAFGRITVEAMFNGCLVIGRNKGGTKEIIETVGVGKLYNNIEDLIEIMIDIAGTGVDVYQEELISAMKTAIFLFSEEENAKLINNYYLNTVLIDTNR